MLVSEGMDDINDSLRGLDDTTPSANGEEWNYWLRRLNRKISELYRSNKDLSASFQILEVGTISASAAPEFDLDDTFVGAASAPYCIDSDGHRTNLTLITPKEANASRREVFVASVNPQKLYFSNEITATESIVGATLYLPSYCVPDPLTAASDDIPVSNPYWATTATAADIAFNDLTYEDKAADLNAQANALYTEIISLDRGNTYGNARKVPTNVNPIRGTKRR